MSKLWLLVWVAACGSGDGGTSSVPLDQLGSQLSTAECAKSFQCCTQDQLSTLFESAVTLTTTAQCQTYVDQLLSGFAVPQYMASVAAGRADYDPEAAGACVSLIGGQSCAEFDMSRSPTSPGGCSRFLTPLVAVGGACSQSYECIDGYCKGAVTLPAPMDGTCAAMPAMGQACTSVCAAGLYCDQGTATCQPLKADGAMCAAGFECSHGGCATGSCGPICG
jgi:hypothetical protein